MSPLLRRDLTAGLVAGLAVALLLRGTATWDTMRSAAGGPTAARRKEQVLTSAPALWALIVVIALVLPILLA